MKRVGFLLKVKQALIPEYVEHHKNVWPEMQEALRRLMVGRTSLVIAQRLSTLRSADLILVLDRGSDGRWQKNLHQAMLNPASIDGY